MSEMEQRATFITVVMGDTDVNEFIGSPLVFNVLWPSFSQATRDVVLKVSPFSLCLEQRTLIASKQNNATKNMFSFSFSAFEESGMLESDEVYFEFIVKLVFFLV